MSQNGVELYSPQDTRKAKRNEIVSVVVSEGEKKLIKFE